MYAFKLEYLIFVPILLLGGLVSETIGQEKVLQGWETNTDKKLIDLDELKAGGPSKDGIPSIDSPAFISQQNATEWIESSEPVIALEVNGRVRAYPLQILIWHEIVNDRIGGKPVLVTFCPLCYSALVFSRKVDGQTLEFGVSGFLRHSDLVMFDRKTETLWQQFTGKAIVGDYVGTTLQKIPSQIISFAQFRKAYPSGKVLSKETGYDRNYGSNPYAGYDNINNTPFMLDVKADGRLPPMAKVIGVTVNDQKKAYPYSISREKAVINDTIGEKDIVVFHTEGARSALDASKISQSREAGSTGVFYRQVEEKTLHFTYQEGKLIDRQTQSVWNITGRAISGTLKGTQLTPVNSGDYFAFAWLVFWPETKIYGQ